MKIMLQQRITKSEFSDYDMNDPRQDHNQEIQEYDVLESEPESDADKITEEM